MKNLKRYGLIAAVVLIAALGLILFLTRGNQAVNSYDNLLANGDFSQLDGNGNPVSWYMDAYGGLNGAEFSVEQTADGPAAHIVNVEAKDARYAQTVKVAPDAIYRLHGYIRASAEGDAYAPLCH